MKTNNLKNNAKYSLLILLFLLFGTNYCPANGRSNTAPDDQLFNNYDRGFTKTIKDAGINGAAIALFNEDKIIWSNVYGCLDDNEDIKVNPETIFSIQSISKTVTATAVMLAVQQGLIDLDKPITDYIPEFTVNSCFEKDPQKKITMRALLSHTAGFTHEAPVGNNVDPSFPSYEAHIKSISDTWLKFPVGSKYSYSNLGMDLAAYIVERVSKTPFPDFLEKQLFIPLGMNVTTIKPDAILNNTNRAIGHFTGLAALPAVIPLYGSGAVYTSMNDFVKFVQFHLKLGNTGSRQLLEKKYLLEMYTPVMANYHTYALGIAISKEDSSYAYTHSGGGFGFGATIKWYPEYHIGIIVLTNKQYENAVYGIACGIANHYIKQNKIVIDSAGIGFNPIKCYEQLESNKSNNEQSIKCPGDSVFKPLWDKYIGTYTPVIGEGYKIRWYAKIARFFGIGKDKMKVYKKDDCLYLKGEGDEKLYEFEPGLFFTSQGEALDFRGESPRYRNIKLE